MLRFRPRYSLLTLLVLTALVAGGVKLWRGPHRVLLSTPCTNEEAALLNHLGCAHPLLEDASQQMELVYTNHFHGKVYSTLRGRPTTMVHFFFDQTDREPWLLNGDLARDLALGPEAERLHSWISRPPTREVVEQIEELYRGNVCGAGHYALAGANRLYLISTHGRLFKAKGLLDLELFRCELIEPSAIEDPLVRDWLNSEISSMNRNKQPPVRSRLQ